MVSEANWNELSANMKTKDKDVIESIIKRATVCRIGLSENNVPYVVPLIFGYEDSCLYFHSAPKGRKIDTIKQNHNVCFEMDIDCELVKKTENPCTWDMKYYSVIGFGKASFTDDLEEKRRALNIIVAHYSDNSHEYTVNEINKVAIIKVAIDSMTWKKSGY